MVFSGKVSVGQGQEVKKMLTDKLGQGNQCRLIV
jgi:hypothetical protein